MKRFLNWVFLLAEDILYWIAELLAFGISIAVTAATTLLFLVLFAFPVGVAAGVTRFAKTLRRELKRRFGS